MDNHEHRWFIFETKTAFEPYTQSADSNLTDLYERVEYAVMGCACGAVQKRRIKNGDNPA